jgi:hypothetical protein
MSSSSPLNSQSNNDYSKENSKKDKKSFGQKAKDSAEKRENKLLSSNPNINNPNRNVDFVEKKQVVVQQENRKDKKSSKHWNDKLIQQEIQLYDDSVEDAARAATEEEEEEFLEYDEEEEEEREDRSQGPPPIDPEELERMNEHCFQFAMELRQRNDNELYDFVMKKQLEELSSNAWGWLENDDYLTVGDLKNQNLQDEAEIKRIRERINERKLLIENEEKGFLNEQEDDDDSMPSLITISDDDDMPGLEVCDADSTNVYML